MKPEDIPDAFGHALSALIHLTIAAITAEPSDDLREWAASECERILHEQWTGWDTHSEWEQ